MGRTNSKPRGWGREGPLSPVSFPHPHCVSSGPGSVTPSPPLALRESPAAPEAARWGFQQLRERGPQSAPRSGFGALLIPWGPLLSKVAFPVGTAAVFGVI